MSEIEKRLKAALAAASTAINSARSVLAKALHSHELPGGDLTDPAEDTDGHQHRMAGDQMTGPAIATDEGHVHSLPGGGRSKPPFVPGADPEAAAPAADDADKAAHRDKKKPKRRKDAAEDALPVLLLDDPAAAVKRMREGETAGYLSKRSRVAKIGVLHALVGDDKVWAIVTQQGPVPIVDLETADEYVRKAVGASDFVGKGYYLPIRLSVVFDPPLALLAPLGKRKEITLDADTGDSDEPVTKPILVQPLDDEAAHADTDPPPAPVEDPPADDPPEIDNATVPVRLIKRHTADNADGSEHFVMGIVLVPGEEDSHGDIYDVETVQNAAHSFMENGGVRKIMHNGEPVEGIVVLETYLTRTEEVHKGEGGTSLNLPVGTWLLAVRITSQELWEAVQDGTFTGFSMGGSAIREEL